MVTHVFQAYTNLSESWKHVASFQENPSITMLFVDEYILYLITANVINQDELYYERGFNSEKVFFVFSGEGLGMGASPEDAMQDLFEGDDELQQVGE
jgi:hypothetical protein